MNPDEVLLNVLKARDNMNKTPPQQSKLDEILAEYIDDRGNTNYISLETALNQYMLDSFIELLDLKWDGTTWAQKDYWKGQDELRNQLRQAAKEKYGE